LRDLQPVQEPTRRAARLELGYAHENAERDIARLRRTAVRERFDASELRSRTEVQLAGRRPWGDDAQIEGGAALLPSPAGLAGRLGGILLRESMRPAGRSEVT